MPSSQSKELHKFFSQLIIEAMVFYGILFPQKCFRKICFVFAFFGLIHFRKKMQNFAKKFANYKQKFLHFFAKVFVHWKP